MGAYRYCRVCSASMDAPTIQEAVRGVQSCNSCGRYTRDVDPEEKEMAVDSVMERIDRIEKHLGLEPG